MPPELNLQISPRTVQQEAVGKLRLAIFSGVFQPGTRLVESQLCAQLASAGRRFARLYEASKPSV